MGRPAQVTREQVMSAARAEFSRRGYEGTTLAAIAARVGISAAAVLRHASTKEALFAAAMKAGDAEDTIPMDRLASLDASSDPDKVLRNLAREFVPFLDAKLDERIARWMHAKTVQDARTIAMELRHPFGRKPKQTPPQRALKGLADYFQRAKRAGRMNVRDPRAAAMAFLGSLHSYVFLNRIVNILDPPIPLERYLDTVLEVWTRGAIRPRRRKS